MATPFLKGVDLRGQRAVGAADGSAATDLVTLQQLQAAIRGIDWKDSVRAASTGNLNLAAPGATIDGVAMAVGNRFLAKDQTTASQNGIYVWNGAATAATRAADADANVEVTAGMAVTSTEGTTNVDKAWILTTNDAIVIDTTALAFTQLGGASTPYTNGNGLSLIGQTFAVVPDTGILVTASGVKVDPSIVARNYAADCAATTNPQVFTHGLGKDDVIVAVKEAATGQIVYPDVILPPIAAAGTFSVDWGSAPTAGQYRVIAKG
jgi:phage-related tail fiber protein